MGICGDDGKPILLVFDCVDGVHEIYTMDGVKLKKPIEELARIKRIPLSKIAEVSYKYEPLNKNKKIRDLDLPSGAVLSVKIVRDTL